MSRAERIKQEKAEQERIRKEFEREKAAAKAKAAREKKREKEELEREQKRKQGVPLVKVRPSQDTIARFVRGNGTGKKRNAAGQPLGDEDGQPDSPTLPVELPEETTDKTCATTENDPSIDKKELDLIPEDDESDLEQLLETVANERPPADIQKAAAADMDPDEFDEILDDDQQELPTAGAIKPREEAISDSETRNEPSFTKPASPSIQPVQARAVLQPLPSSPLYQLPPLSTQAILGNLDEYFPTSSQQMRELEEEVVHDPGHTALKPIATPAQPKAEIVRRIRPLSPPPPPPPRFFTSSGTRELVSLALQRSRRTAALEDIYEQERVQAQMEDVKKRNRQEIKVRAHRPQSKNVPRPAATEKPDAATSSVKSKDASCESVSFVANKENAKPGEMSSYGLSSFGVTASQETEYGGGWIDDEALDIIL